jgi:hypothetical protein
MGLQIRSKVGAYGGNAFAPSRDIINCFAPLCSLACQSLGRLTWEPWYKDLLETTGTTEADLGEAAAALAKFINGAADPRVKTCEEAVARSGLLAVKDTAKLVLMAKLGDVCAAYFWTCARDALRARSEPAGGGDLIEEAERVLHSFTNSRAVVLLPDRSAE